MSGYVFFQMWEPFRQSLIAGHLFYIEQAQKRLLSQFANIEHEADMAAERWLEENGHHFDPDRHDPGEFEERAYDASVEFYGLMCDLREQTKLSVVAGMYHEWEKQLRDWLVREIQHWHRGSSVKRAVWKVHLGKVMDLLEELGWNVRDTDFFPRIDACRLVINVYKHGEGDSLDELKKKYPQYLNDPFRESEEPHFGADYLDFTRLKVTPEHVQEFSDAIVSFWKAVPDNIQDHEGLSVPDWFAKAMLSDQQAASYQQGGPNP
nr:hypothetical protein [Halomonas socia]